MKGPSCAFVASVVAAASTAALSSSSSSDSGDRNAAFHAPSNSKPRLNPTLQRNTSETDLSDQDRFAPRFDGLRFIETLVTAHR